MCEDAPIRREGVWREERGRQGDAFIQAREGEMREGLTARALTKDASGTSPSEPNRLYVWNESAVPFLKLKRSTGSPPEDAWRTSSATAAA